MADPNALVVVQAAAAAFERVGLPEGQFHLAHAALYLATTAKSNTTLGYYDALESVRRSAMMPFLHISVMPAVTSRALDTVRGTRTPIVTTG